MKNVSIFCFALVLSFIISVASNADTFYKKVEIGTGCSFEIPFLWEIKNVFIKLPHQTRDMLVQYESKQLIGKEIAATATFMKGKKNISIDGAINETISQISLMKGVIGFKYSLENYYIKNTTSKICFMSYLINNTNIYIKSIYIIPHHNPKIAYNVSVHYTKEYSKEVANKIFASIDIN